MSTVTSIRCNFLMNGVLPDSSRQMIYEPQEDAPDSEQRLAIEQFFDHLLALNMVSQIILTDRYGRLIFSVFDARPPTDKYCNPLLFEESNVVVSAGKLFDALEDLRQKMPVYMHAQFHNAIVVQVRECGTLLTVIGERAKGHFMGGVLATVEMIRSSKVFLDAVKRIQPYVKQ